MWDIYSITMENRGDVSGTALVAVHWFSVLVERVKSTLKTQGRVENYPPLGLISHSNGQFWGHLH